jgi:multiple sugar transport system ATP-binding protein
VRRPAAFLMDEPLGALDADLRESMRAEIRALQLRLKATTVYVTHDQIEAMAMGDRIVVMSAAEVQQVGTPIEVYNNPANLFVARFIGSPGMNLVKGHYADGMVRLPGGDNRFAVPPAWNKPIAAGLGGAGEVVLGFRPESAQLNFKGALSGQVYATNMYGAFTMVSLNMNEGDIVHIRGERTVDYPVGANVNFDLNAPMVRYFDPKTENAIKAEG